MQNIELKKNWTLTADAFQRFLKWLNEGSDFGGEKYLEMRQRLVAYFDRKNCLTPDELADETLNRVARRLEEEGAIESETPAKYCYIVARFVFMEHLRTTEKRSVSLDDRLHQPPDNSADLKMKEAADHKEKLLDCLEKCADLLEPISREIIIKYYYGKERVKIENRQALAKSLNITGNALTIRACRIRTKLENCVKKCAEK